MAIDTAAKRSSAVLPLSPWRARLPAPDGTIGLTDREAVPYLYAGISSLVTGAAVIVVAFDQTMPPSAMAYQYGDDGAGNVDYDNEIAAPVRFRPPDAQDTAWLTTPWLTRAWLSGRGERGWLNGVWLTSPWLRYQDQITLRVEPTYALRNTLASQVFAVQAVAAGGTAVGTPAEITIDMTATTTVAVQNIPNVAID